MMNQKEINELVIKLCQISSKHAYPLVVPVKMLSVDISDARKLLLMQWVDDHKEKIMVAHNISNELSPIDMINLCALALPDAIQCLLDIEATSQILSVVIQTYSLAFDAHMELANVMHKFVMEHTSELDMDSITNPYLIYAPFSDERFKRDTGYTFDASLLFDEPNSLDL